MGLQNFYATLLGYCKLPTCHCRRNKRLRFGPWVGETPWRGNWRCTPVFLPGELHGQRGLSCYGSWGHKSQTWLSNWTLTHLDIELNHACLSIQTRTHWKFWLHLHLSPHLLRQEGHLLWNDTLENPLWPSPHFASWGQYLQIKGKLL